jgi:hypothetical protein
MRNKFGNKKIKDSEGIIHDSKREYIRWMELKLLEQNGEIKDLRRQVSYELIPTQREASTETYKSGKNKGKLKEGRVIEKAVVYIADFVYTDSQGQTVVEDVKGYNNPSSAGYAKFVIIRKLMLYLYGIRIREV